MDEALPQKKQGCSKLSLTVALIVFSLLFAAAFSTYRLMTYYVQEMHAAAKARHVLGLLMVYAAEHNGQYPDHDLTAARPTSNEAFRRLAQEGLVHEELPFGTARSPFIPDKNIGRDTEYAQFLEPGENHWMMTAGINAKSPPFFPLVWENAADASWPPSWLRDNQGASVRGRVWLGSRIIIGFNDASVLITKLIEKENQLHLPPSILAPKGKNPLPELKILDIDVR
ncbi:hypothetical protein WJU23_00535 [Prosthecobacter sp. SYSU 5D2]|uniref:hypothetical protein n=1 Tax=Prosthecobacter sp. SYSU 5D2 TaxID=3134134 RepID=UPI0031FF358E